MIKRRWRPSTLRMTQGTIRRKLRNRVVRIRRSRIFRIVATVTGVRSVVVIAVVASGTIIRDCSMRPIQLVIIIVDREQCRLPTWRRRVTSCTIR